MFKKYTLTGSIVHGHRSRKYDLTTYSMPGLGETPVHTTHPILTAMLCCVDCYLCLADSKMRIREVKSLARDDRFYFFLDFIYLFLERGKEREESIDVRENHQSAASQTPPNWGPSPQFSHVPWLEIEPVTLSRPNNRATPIRAQTRYFRRMLSYLPYGRSRGSCSVEGLQQEVLDLCLSSESYRPGRFSSQDSEWGSPTQEVLSQASQLLATIYFWFHFKQICLLFR